MPDYAANKRLEVREGGSQRGTSTDCRRCDHDIVAGWGKDSLASELL